MMGNTGWSDRLRYFIFAAYLLLIGLLVWWIRAALTPLVIAGLIAYLINPLVNYLVDKTRMKHSVAVGLVFILSIASLIAVPAFIVPIWLDEIQSLTNNLDIIYRDLQARTATPIEFLGLTIRLRDYIPDFSVLVSEGLTNFTGDAFHLLEATTRNLLWVLVILVTVFYLLRDWHRLRDWILGLAPSKYHHDFRFIYREITKIWRGYLRGNLALMGVVGIIFTIAWTVMGVPGALILGLIAGLLTIIPDLGPAIAAVLAVLVALVEGSTFLPISNFWFGVLVFGVYLILINIKNIWIRPRIFGRSVHMHDGIVFVSIIIAVVIAGILGALIVVPLLASLGVVGRYIWRRIMDEEPFPELVREMGQADEVVEEKQGAD